MSAVGTAGRAGPGQSCGVTVLLRGVSLGRKARGAGGCWEAVGFSPLGMLLSCEVRREPERRVAAKGERYCWQGWGRGLPGGHR